MPRTLEQIAAILEERRQRATYGAVAEYLGRPPQSLMVGSEKNTRNSFVVNSDSKLPTNYAAEQYHPELTINEHVITNCDELRQFLSAQ